MSLAVGIVGLPNVGKSTLFNALTRAQNAEAANYPFCTIEPNKATAPVADPRVEKLAEICKSGRIVHATVDFTDIAGLVRGASKGEGLGNQFLGNIRECDAILEVVRCFDNDDVVHVEGSVDPIRDVGIIETELVLADLQSLEKRLDRISRQARADKSLAKEVEAMTALRDHLDAGEPARTFEAADPDAIEPTRRELRLLTDKPIIYVANVGEGDLGQPDNPHVQALKAHAAAHKCDTVTICAAMEADLAGLSDEILRPGAVRPGRHHPHGLPHPRPAELLHRRPDGGQGLDHPPRLDGPQGRRRHPLRLRARLHPRRGRLLRRLRRPDFLFNV